MTKFGFYQYLLRCRSKPGVIAFFALFCSVGLQTRLVDGAERANLGTSNIKVVSTYNGKPWKAVEYFQYTQNRGIIRKEPVAVEGGEQVEWTSDVRLVSIFLGTCILSIQKEQLAKLAGHTLHVDVSRSVAAEQVTVPNPALQDWLRIFVSDGDQQRPRLLSYTYSEDSKPGVHKEVPASVKGWMGVVFPKGSKALKLTFDQITIWFQSPQLADYKLHDIEIRLTVK